MAMPDIPQALFDDLWLDEPLYLVNSGKEGTVWCCSAAERIDRPLVAVKVYRPREMRSFRNDSIYTQGRPMGVRIDKSGRVRAAGAPDKRLERAVRNRAGVGIRALEFSWTSHEVLTLQAMHAAGARVPEVYTATGNAIVMEFFGDADMPAPKLKQVTLSNAEAARCWRLLIDEISLWLRYERIHGDLSPFNVLYWQAGPIVIDAPQAVSPFENPMAYSLLERDVGNMCGYFRGVPGANDPGRIVADLWQRYVLIPPTLY
jgi:RIO kinase 1